VCYRVGIQVGFGGFRSVGWDGEGRGVGECAEEAEAFVRVEVENKGLCGGGGKDGAAGAA
jgi:hypothetical protein